MTVRVATFWVGGLFLGVDVERVLEVLSTQTVTPVPLAPPGVLGLLNLRGQLVTAVDGRHRLGLPSRNATDVSVNFIMRKDHETLSLVVDREGDVVDLEATSCEKLPSTIHAEIRDLVTGAYQLERELLFVLDADLALSVTSG